MRKKSVPTHIYTNKIQTLKTPCTSVLSALTIQSRRMQHRVIPFLMINSKNIFHVLDPNSQDKRILLCNGISFAGMCLYTPVQNTTIYGCEKYCTGCQEGSIQFQLIKEKFVGLTGLKSRWLAYIF